jgi:hypothetical protein
VSRFCRHNRLTVDCPICSKDALPAPAPKPRRSPARAKPGGTRSGRRGPAPGSARASRGPFAAAGPYEDGREIRLERVPGGLRLAAWRAGEIARQAPVLPAHDVAGLLRDAATKELVSPPPPFDADAVAHGEHGASPGRAGELKDELRVERLDADRVRIARWVLRPNAGWQLQEAPVLLPPARFEQALAAAAHRGVLVSEPEP